MAEGQDTAFSCACGTLGGHVHGLGPATAVHIVCFCADCRAADRYLGQPDPETSGIDLVQLNPSDITIERGEEHLALMRLYPSGLLRWYADCCKTPMFNTVATPKVRMAAIRTHSLDHPNRAGPVRARGFVPKRGGKQRTEHVMRMVWPILVRSLSGLMTGEWRATPFFDPSTSRPVRPPKVLTEDERRELGLTPKVPRA